MQMLKMKNIFTYFTKLEWTIWISSVMLILLSFIIFDKENYMALAASILGVTVAFYFILEAFDTANIVPSTLSVTMSFVAFFVNDVYAFVSWKRMEKRQISSCLNGDVIVKLFICRCAIRNRRICKWRNG